MKWLAANWHWIALLVFAMWAMNQYGQAQNAEKVEAARVAQTEALAEQKRLQAEVSELEGEVVAHEQQVTELKGQLEQKLAAIESHEQTIAKLREQQEARELSVRDLRTEDELVQRYKATYPAVSRAQGLGIIELRHEGLSVPYLAIPAWFAETHIIEHDRLATCQGTVEEHEAIQAKYGEAVDLSQRIAEQEREIARLQAEAKEKYRIGYEDAMARTQELTDKYVAELKKPMFDLPGWGDVALCGAASLGGLYLIKQF